MTFRSNAARTALGFLTVEQTDALGDVGVHVLDPGSTLVSATASDSFAAGVVLYPNVIVECDPDGRIDIGSNTRLYPGAVLIARGGASITIGAGCEFGPGVVHVHADGPADVIMVGDEVRLAHGCELSGASRLGRGSQILGAVIARSVTLGGGHGGHRWPDPDERGAVLKGAGLADGVTLEAGEVRSCRVSFAGAPRERQTAYHPRT